MGKYSDNFIGNYLRSSALHQPEGLCVVYGTRRVTWGEINERVNRLAQALLALGVKKDDKVSFMFHNCPEFLEVNWAIQKAGAIPVPMNYRFTPREIIYQGEHSDSVLFLLEDLWYEPVKKAMPELKRIKEFILKGHEKKEGFLDYEELIASHKPEEPHVPTGLDDVCVMIYTGGTTGPSKGVMLTYGAHVDMFEAFLANLVVRLAQIKFSPEQKQALNQALTLPGTNILLRLLDLEVVKKIMARPGTEKLLRKALRRLLTDPDLLKRNYAQKMSWMIPSLPLFHDASYQLLILSTITGNNVIYLTEGVSFNPRAIFEMIQRERIMFMANVPTGWKKLVDDPEIGNYDLRSLVIAASGAGVNPASLKKKIMEKFPGIIVMDLFGQTEMTPITTMRIDSSPETIKDRSVGKTILQAKIVDENGKELPRGQVGEILYKSTTVMKGYYKDEGKTAEAFLDGWFRSGDLGYIDEDGELRVVERKKECISTGGEKVFPQEVEEIIEQHPCVEKVCVIGVPDEEWGNTVRAVVMLKPGKTCTEEEIIEFCKDKMAGYKKPRSVVFTDEFPISPVGKILRAKVREMHGK